MYSKVKEIRTVYCRVAENCNRDFDRVVNNLLNEGYEIKEFTLIETDNERRNNMLFALLVKERK